MGHGWADNGILARIPGLYISDGQRELPPATPNAPAQLQSLIEVPEIGLVRITYWLTSSRHRKTRNWFWVARHAEAVAPKQ